MKSYNKIKRVVIKIGSSSIVDEGVVLEENIKSLAQEVKRLKEDNINVIIVSSGAIALGRKKLFLDKPKKMSVKQACAAVGQVELMNTYTKFFGEKDLMVAQILLNHDDFEHRVRFNNLKNIIDELLFMNIVPIINENDALTVEEIKVGDNDTLAAYTSSSLQGDVVILVSDIDGLYDKDPRILGAKKIDEVFEITKEIQSLAGDSASSIGTGGMKTKIKAAKIAASAGCDMIILHNKMIGEITNVLRGEKCGTVFHAKNKILHAKERWILNNATPKGKIFIDNGAKNALMERKSLLPKGITAIEGFFKKEDIVELVFENTVIAKGITNYNHIDLAKIKGLSSKDIKSVLGYDGKKDCLHANGIILLD